MLDTDDRILDEYNRGMALSAERRFDEAFAVFTELVEHIHRELPSASELAFQTLLFARYRRGSILMRQGKYAEGLPEISLWFRVSGEADGLDRRAYWRGEPLNGRTVLLVGDAGFGDTIHGLRFAPYIEHRFGGQAVIAAQKQLVPLLRQSMPRIKVVPVNGEPVGFDCWRNTMGLLELFGTAWPGPYLHADAIQVARWRERLRHLPGMRVGLIWQGNVRNKRSMPLERLGPLFDAPGVSFVSVQHGGEEEIQRSGFPIADFSSENNWPDFADTAALMMALDLVISVDTGPAHLAGALGKPLWLLACHEPCWRWDVGATSPWYPSARVWRQPQPEDWGSVVDQVRQALLQLAPGR